MKKKSFLSWLLAIAAALVPLALVVYGFFLPIHWVGKVAFTLSIFAVVDLMFILFDREVDGSLAHVKSLTEAVLFCYFGGTSIALALYVGVAIFYGFEFFTTMVQVAFVCWLVPVVVVALVAPFKEDKSKIASVMSFMGGLLFLGVLILLGNRMFVHLFELSLPEMLLEKIMFMMRILFYGLCIVALVRIIGWIGRKVFKLT